MPRQLRDLTRGGAAEFHDRNARLRNPMSCLVNSDAEHSWAAPNTRRSHRHSYCATAAAVANTSAGIDRCSFQVIPIGLSPACFT
jgi:hypothetical protein